MILAIALILIILKLVPNDTIITKDDLDYPDPIVNDSYSSKIL